MAFGFSRVCAGQQTETANYTYDRLNRLTGVVYSGGPAIVYTYDAAGNRTAVQVSATSALPVVTSLSPGSAAVGGQGFTLTVTGLHFAGNSEVRWAGASRPTTFVNDTTLTAVLSAADAAGPASVNVTVFNPSAGATSNAAAFTFTPSLRLDSVAPRVGRDVGGQQLKLTGSFAGLTSVTLGGVPATWSFTNGTSEVTLTTPPHTPGAVTISLTAGPDDVHSKPNAFAYLPTSFTDDPLVAGVTQAKAQHVIELRQAVDFIRAAQGLGPAPWAEPVLVNFVTPIKAEQIQELRTYLEDAAGRLGYTAGSYTDPSLGSGSVIKRVYIEELRERIKVIAGDCPGCLL
jgi:YD repeat-containing protein